MADSQNADEELRLLIERIERLEEEKKGVSDDIRDTYSEAKSRGYEPKIIRQVIRLRARCAARPAGNGDHSGGLQVRAWAGLIVLDDGARR